MITTAEEALKSIRSRDKVFIHTASGSPDQLIKALVDRAPELRDVEIFHLHTEGEAPYSKPEYRDSFHIKSLFVGENIRNAISEGRGSYIPVFLSEAPILFRNKIIPIDVALISVSPPDRHGYCSLGVSVDCSKAAMESARLVIAQINNFMPRTHGDGLIHINNIDIAIEYNEPIEEIQPHPPSTIETQIGRYVATLVEDGATLQMGIGAIPNAVLEYLGNHRNLGIHTELLSDGILPLLEKGVITNSLKKKYRGRVVSTFVLGSKKLYDFADDNPLITVLEADYVNKTSIIAKNPKVTAINSAIEIDLTGQVCADSIGTRMYSGVGGQMDFIRGAALSNGGKPIIALPSTTQKGKISRIVSTLKPGAGVVTTRAHVHYVATEYGVVNLYGKSLTERAKLLIEIAHPEHRERLEKEAYQIFKNHVLDE